MPLEGDVEVTIRHAQSGDAAALAQLMCKLDYETTRAEMRQRLRSISSDARYSTIVAEINGVVCGMIGTLTHASYEHNDPSGKIIALVVSRQSDEVALAARSLRQRRRISREETLAE